MMLFIPQNVEDKTVKFSFTKSGYQEILLHREPEYQEYTDDDGDKYAIAEIPEMYLCRDDEIDSDGDNYTFTLLD